MIGTPAYFFVGSKAQSDFTVFNFGMCQQILHSRDDFGNAGLVVRSKQSKSIGADEILTGVMEKFGKLLRRQHNVFFSIKDNVLAVVFFNDLRLHLAPRHIGTGIHMGNETDHRADFIGIGRQGGHYIGIFVEADLLQTDLTEFFGQFFCKFHL